METTYQTEDRAYTLLLHDAPELAHIIAQRLALTYGGMAAAEDTRPADVSHWGRLARVWSARVRESFAVAYPEEV